MAQRLVDAPPNIMNTDALLQECHKLAGLHVCVCGGGGSVSVSMRVCVVCVCVCVRACVCVCVCVCVLKGRRVREMD